MDDDDKPASDRDDGGLIAEAKRRLQRAIDDDSSNRAEALKDLRFLAGEQWDDRVKRMRELDGRPSLTINKLPTFLQQVTNDQRQNKPSIKIHPVDSNADPDTARVLQGLIRHIEYASNADVAYDTAVNSAAACGIGWWRLVTDYESPDSFNQVIRFDRIRNPFQVYVSRYKEADGSDMRWAMIACDMPRDEFRYEYPDADASQLDWQTGIGDSAGWITQQTVRVVEYYRVECTPATLVMLDDGTVLYEDDVPEGAIVRQRRQSERRSVRWYKMTATEVLERTEVPCYWIPMFPVTGAELDIEGRVVRSGLIRNARDPQYMYNLWMSAATEEVALRPKVPYIGAEGQFEGHEQEWRQANVRNFAYLEYKPRTIGGQLAPPPQRQPMADIPLGTLQMAMHANDNIKATTGIFDASLGARGNETSGRAILARQREGDTATYHFIDNLARVIRHCGRCILWMAPRVYDGARVVRLLGEDERLEYAQINTPLPQPELDEKTQRIRTVLNDLTVGTYDVTVSMGPSYSTLRQEAADAMVSFGQSWPRLMEIAGDKVVKAMDWPGAEEIAERIERTIPPEIRGDDRQAGQPEIPPAVQQAVQQMQQYVQQLEQQLADAQSGVEVARIRAEAQIESARISAESRADVAELAGWVKLLAQRMEPPPPALTDAALQIGNNEPPPIPEPGIPQ